MSKEKEEKPKPTLQEINEKFPKRNGFYYIQDGNQVLELPSVTEILQAISKPALISWGIKLASLIALQNPLLTEEEVTSLVYSKRAEAAELGKTIHSLLEAFLSGIRKPLEEIPSELKGYVQAFYTFFDEFQPEILHTEKIAYSKKYGYAGTCDCILRTKNQIWLCDFKTGKTVYKEAGLQLVAYKEALKEMNLEEIRCPNCQVPHIEKMVCLHLKQDGTFNLLEFNEDFEVFLACKKLWEWQNSEELKERRQND